MLKPSWIVLALLCAMYFITYIDRVNIGPMWAVPMDIAPSHAGTASGLMNCGSAFAAIVSPLVAGWVIDLTGNWYLPFLLSMALLLLGRFSALLMRPERRFEDEPPLAVATA